MNKGTKSGNFKQKYIYLVVSMEDTVSASGTDAELPKQQSTVSHSTIANTMHSMMAKLHVRSNRVGSVDAQQSYDVSLKELAIEEASKLSSKQDHLIVVRNHSWAHFIHNRLLSTPHYRIFSVVLVIIALFLYDISRSLLSPTTDVAVEIVLATVFGLLMLDLILQSIAYAHYLGSIFFVLDFVGTLSLAADLSVTYGILGISRASLIAARGHRAGRVARSAATLRLTKIVVWTKIARLIRLTRLYTFMKNRNWKAEDDTHENTLVELSKSKSYMAAPSVGSHTNDHEGPRFFLDNLPGRTMNEADNDDEQASQYGLKKKLTLLSTAQSEFHQARQHSRISTKVSDAITRDIVIGILLTVTLTPLLTSVQEESYSAIYLASKNFDYYVSTYDGTSGIEDYTDIFLDEQPTVAVLTINDVSFLDTLGDNYHDNVRDDELLIVTSTYTSITVDESDTWRFIYGMNVAYTFLIIVLFSGISLWVVSSVRKLVLIPIENISSTVYGLTQKMSIIDPDFTAQDTKLLKMDETEIIDKTLKKIYTMFKPVLNHKFNSNHPHTRRASKIQLQNNGHGSDSALLYDPILSDDASARTKTQFVSRTGGLVVVTIQAINKPFISNAYIKKQINSLGLKNNSSDEQIESDDMNDDDNEEDNGYNYGNDNNDNNDENDDHDPSAKPTENDILEMVKDNPELTNTKSIVADPIASQYFRCFCINRFLGNRYLFVNAVDEYTATLKHEFIDIYKKYIADMAECSMAVAANVRQNLIANLKECDIGTKTFDQANKESYEILQAQGYSEFLRSSFAKAYIHAKHNVFKSPEKILKVSSTQLASTMPNIVEQ